LVADISVVLLNYNTRDMLAACIDSLLENGEGLELELIVVDNASRDGSAEMVRERFPAALLVENSENTGSARGTNMGIEISSAPFVLILNPDTLIKEEALELMLGYLKSHPDVGLVGPRLVGGDGEYQQSCHYFTILESRYAILLFLTLMGIHGCKRFGLFTNPAVDGSKMAEVDWIYTACALVRREVFERVGLLDEDLFFGGDDMELCYRAARAGWKTVYLPQAEIVHYGNQSAQQVFGGAHSYARAKHRVFALDHFQRKHFSAAHSYIMRALLGLGSLAVAALLWTAYLLEGRKMETAARAWRSLTMGTACLASLIKKPGAIASLA
jgi:GT2 family glycosyltransferase